MPLREAKINGWQNVSTINGIIIGNFNLHFSMVVSIKGTLAQQIDWLKFIDEMLTLRGLKHR